ncbi:hypothetical protein SHI21_17570 [Bacteriovorax sp. PP10]|uniref:Uncharacterized protein n=1 Tax=Bacteriovorax antarcticus TaxID=3088717 RepID=A0ABU5VYA4_9BACT|nr:hypothetical protein [Bacteriovorax sp. PP10]MEA9358046.1 hypothetical protein [Bacteriovorax sp. PP10]
MSRLLQYFLCGTFLLTTTAFATDCVNCGPKNVTGLPSNNSLDDLSKIVQGGQTQKFVSQGYCMQFAQIPQEMVGTMIKELETTGYPVERYLTDPICQPAGYSVSVKSPMLHAIADDVNKREEFLNNIWLYYSKKRKQPEIFDQAVNAKNSKGETLLDYIETQRKNNSYPLPEQQPPLEKIIKMLCAHGGVYAKNPNKKCP